MTTISQKQEIVESINNLDAIQSEKVLEFIRTLNGNHQSDVKQEKSKSRVLKEIRALAQARLWI